MFSKQPWMYSSVRKFYNDVIPQSLRFEEGGTHYLDFTPSQAGTDNKKYTISVWIKLAQGSGDFRTIFSSKNAGAGTGQGHNTYAFGIDEDFEAYTENGGANPNTTTKYRDRGSWAHYLIAYDSTQSTASDRVKLFVNGTRDTTLAGTFPGLNSVMSSVNTNTRPQQIGKYVPGYTRHFNGYMADFHMVDGQALAPTYFGETKEGIWIPVKYEDNGTTSHGINGYHLTFQGTGTATTSQGTTAQTNIGDDQSGNGNNFAVYNLAAHDVVPDSPENNFATFNSLHTVPATTFLEGNLRANVTNVHKSVYATQTMKTGTGSNKYYFEAHAISGSANKFTIGLTDERNTQFQQSAGTNHIIAYSGHNSYLYGDAVGLYHNSLRKNGSVIGSSLSSPFTGGDIAMIAFDAETGKVWVGQNGTWLNGSGTDSTTLDLNNHDTTVAIGNDRNYLFGVSAENCNWIANFGQDPTFAGTKSSSGNSDGTTGSFYYSPPSGFIALNTENMQDPVIDPNGTTPENPTDYFDTQLWTGTGSGQSLSNFSFQPDWLWFKHRNGGSDHAIFDSIRGVNAGLSSNNGNTENTNASSSQDLVSFDNDGFTTGTPSQYGSLGSNTHTIVTWAWRGGGSASSNSNGTITSSVSANTEAGFSIVSYTGAGGSSATVGHGLTAAPDYILLKARDAGEGWASQWNTPSMGPTKSTAINSTGSAATSSGEWNNTAPTNTVFTIGNQGRVNTLNKNYIAYCFHNVDGYSKVGQYRGNASTNGTFVYTGFRPAWVLMKNIIDTTHWVIWDSKRGPYNVIDKSIYPSSSDGDQTGSAQYVDFLSNGFKLRQTHNSFNGSNDIHVYFAIAEQPFKYANAR